METLRRAEKKKKIIPVFFTLRFRSFARFRGVAEKSNEPLMKRNETGKEKKRGEREREREVADK